MRPVMPFMMTPMTSAPMLVSLFLEVRGEGWKAVSHTVVQVGGDRQGHTGRLESGCPAIACLLGPTAEVGDRRRDAPVVRGQAGGQGMTGARVALLGAHGHGEVHLRNIARLSAAGAAELVGVADPREPTEAHRAITGPSVPWLADAAELLHTVRPDVTVVCTPIPLHLAHAEAAMEVRSHLLLEKPPTPTLADFHRLTEA